MKIVISTLALAVLIVGVTRLQQVDCFRYYFTSMAQADASINPLQRAFFSLVLAESFHPEKKMGPGGHATPPHKHA